MVLRGSLVDTEIPRRDRLREAVITQWQESFNQLKSDLSVSIGFCRSALLTYIFGHRNPAGGSVSLQISGQTRTLRPT